MAFQMPEYHQPDFSKEQFIKAPDAKWEIVEIDGVAPEYFHSTSMFPEYFKIQGKWVLAEESRMDSSVVICPDGHLQVVENRNLKKGDKVILVDHNEKSQTVDGIENAEVLEIIDHHRLGGLVTATPLFMRVQPVGCTGTIIYQMYKET